MIARVLFVLFSLVAGVIAAPKETQRVVVLYDERTDLPGLAAIDESLIRTLVAGSPNRLEIYREEMDLSRNASAAYLPALRDYLNAKYAGKRIDLAIAIMGPSLDFLLRHRDDVFPAAPIVFAGLDARELRGRPLPAYATGVMLSRQFASTLDVALRLHPDTKQVLFIGGTSEFDTRLIEEARQQLRGYEDRLQIAYLTTLPIEGVLREVSNLPPHTLILYATLFRDVDGSTFVPHEVAERISAIANAPLYGFVDQYLGHGIVGGSLHSVSAHGAEAAKLALQVLSGKPPSDLAPITIGAGKTMLDWRQLQRWNISERRLPPEADVRFRPTSIWTEYQSYVIGTCLIVALQALLISGLLVQRSRRRRAESALNQSEQRLSVAIQAVGMGVWSWDPTTSKISATRECRILLGLSPDGVITFDAFVNRIDPQKQQMLEHMLKKIEREGGSFEIESRLPLPSENVRWVVVRGKLLEHAQKRSPRQLIGVCVDVTARKTSELAARQHLNEIAHMTRLSTMGELGASLSHELNQPLTAILANARAAQRFMSNRPPDVAELPEILQDIVDADLRATNIIRGMRGLAKKGVSEYLSVDLPEAIGEVVNLVRTDAIERHVRVELQSNTSIPKVTCDPIQIQQVTLNVLLNAFDAMGEVPEGEREVTIRLNNVGDRAEVRISDTGIGLTDDMLGQMFNPFYTTKSKGLGMGLAISQSIIEAHGGRIWAENNADRGATLCFTVPFVRTR